VKYLQKHIAKATLILSAVFFMQLSFGQTGKAKQIKILNGSLSYDQSKSEAQMLTDKVVFEHEGAIMNCDVAYLYSKENRIEAFGNIVITQGKDMRTTGDSLFYDGNSKLAKLRGNISMTNNDLTLTTRFLDYDMKNKSAYYYNGGTVKSIKRNNTLTSRKGTFNTENNTIFFKDNVRLENETYTMQSDTLIFNTISEITYFKGPTNIVSKENTIYCENGWYDTTTENASFNKNAVINYGKQILTGDSVYFNRTENYGKAFRNVVLIDTVEKLTINGQYSYFNDSTNYSLITGKPSLEQRGDKDTLHLIADTLELFKDSIKTGYFAYKNVRFYRNDMQGITDSLTYTEKDSLMTFYGNPVFWSGKNQMNADSMRIKTFEGKVYEIFMKQNAFIVEQKDSIHFNQIKGKTITGGFSENELKNLWVRGNGEAIYFMEEDSTITAINKIMCSDILIQLDSNELKNITFYEQPTGTVTPLDQIATKELLLQDFKSYFALRPKSAEELLEGR
jgi:lipopolysaccharide assembly outer membrane protein LptD (OstA)